MLKCITPEQVRLGMFIHGFEGSWFQHPFWATRFVLVDADDLAKVHAANVPKVIINIAKGLDVASDDAMPETPKPVATATPRPAAPRQSWSSGPLMGRAQDKVDKTRDVERAQATRVMLRSKKVMKGVFDSARLGKAVRCADIMSVIDDISESVWRNAHALIGVTRLKSKDEYTYLHSVAVCALMINLGRQLQLDEARVKELGIAGLLHDIGKMCVPDEILNKPGNLTDAEFILVKAHPEKGHDLLLAGEGIADLALDVCRHHHERIDGKGYPHRLAGDAISQAARMGAICDVYDALTSNRAYKKAWSPVQAVSAMASWEGHFDRDILFRFMQSIAVFPEGMLVRLRSNQLAVVTPNGRRASRPRVKAFYSTTDNQFTEPQDIVITDSLANDQIISEEDPAHWNLPDWPALRDRLIGPVQAIAA